MRRALFAALLLSACGPVGGPPAPRFGASAAAPDRPAPVAKEDRTSLGAWTATSFGAYAAPSPASFRASKRVDVVFQFHGARLADKEWRSTDLGAVVVDAELGGTSSAYADAMAVPGRFAQMQDEVLRSLRARTNIPNLTFGRVALLSFSAGYAAVSRVLSNADDASRIDAVVLLDSLHASYEPAAPGTPERVGPFRRNVDRQALKPFVDFAQRAADGEKLLVVTHSDVAPPDYASTTETAFTLTVAVNARLEPRDGRDETGLWASDASDMRGFHMRGYWGATPEAHMAQLHLLAYVVREHLVPRWSKAATPGCPAPGTPCKAP